MFEQGKRLGDNVDTHTFLTFKHVAYLAAEMDLEDEKTKKYFVDSLPPIFHPDMVKRKDGTYK